MLHAREVWEVHVTVRRARASLGEKCLCNFVYQSNYKVKTVHSE